MVNDLNYNLLSAETSEGTSVKKNKKKNLSTFCAQISARGTELQQNIQQLFAGN